MKKYCVTISRYNSVAVEVLADSIEEAEELAMETSLDGMFDDSYDLYEIADSYEVQDYPFEEGDDYYTIEPNKNILFSCWDQESRDIHDENPNRIYFKTFEEASAFVDSLKNNSPIVT